MKTPMLLTEFEVVFIQSLRGTDMTGCYVHETDDGKFYFWAMGSQPANPLTAKNPIAAAKKYLKHFYKIHDSRRWNDCAQPIRRKL